MSIEPPLLVAHRGASGHAPENTIAAFQLALDTNVDGIELDVHMALDGSIVVIHDSTVDRTTNGKGRVGKMTLEQLKSVDAGSWFNAAFPQKARSGYEGQRIPTLSEVMELVRGRARLYIEMKSPDLYPDSLQPELLRIVRLHEMEHDVVFLSFNRRALRKMRHLDAGIPTALLISRLVGDPVKAAVSLGAGTAVSYKLLAPTLVRKIRSAGLGLITWTVDNSEDIARMIDAGVDAIITNYPDRMR